MTTRNDCPACGAGLVSEPIAAPLRCKHCGWHLITKQAWERLSPYGQGYAHYTQASWETSELAGVKNPYAEGTPEHTEFCHGQRRAMLDAQDGEE